MVLMVGNNFVSAFVSGNLTALDYGKINITKLCQYNSALMRH